MDTSTGLYYYGARYYDPELGRFISADTIVQSPYNPQSLNRYTYCFNNPINYTDPTGHWSWGKFWKSFAGMFVGAIVTVVTAGVGTPFWLAGMYGGMLAGATTGGLEGGWKGMLMGAGIGGALGGLGGWGYGIASAHGMAGWFIAGTLAAGAGVAGATNSWDSFAGGLLGGLAGAGVGIGITKAYSEQFANFRAGSGFRADRDCRLERAFAKVENAMDVNLADESASSIIFEQVDMKTGVTREVFLGKEPVAPEYKILGFLGKGFGMKAGIPTGSMNLVKYRYALQEEWAKFNLEWQIEDNYQVLLNKTKIHGTEYWKTINEYKKSYYEYGGTPPDFRMDKLPKE